MARIDRRQERDVALENGLSDFDVMYTFFMPELFRQLSCFLVCFLQSHVFVMKSRPVVSCTRVLNTTFQRSCPRIVHIIKLKRSNIV